MSQDLSYQIRITLAGEMAAAARRDLGSPGLAALAGVLRRHGAVPVNTLDGFERYVAAAEAEGTDAFPLYRWTRDVVADPAKRVKHATSFALHVGGAAVYPKAVADALEAELQPLVGAGVVTSLARHDTDPGRNPQMPAQGRADQA